jgi:hypothetical protein
MLISNGYSDVADHDAGGDLRRVYRPNTAAATANRSSDLG